uniref:Uncharacterized protein n=1 Tax=Arundo donax TaxID=35708 RepID=A0A0A8ZR67_ARUDO
MNLSILHNTAFIHWFALG